MFFTFSIAGTSTIFGMLNLYPLKLNFISNRRFFANESIEFSILASNDSNYSIFDISLFHKNEKRYIDVLKPQEKKTILFKTRFETRGKGRLDAIVAKSLFPLIHEVKTKKLNIDKDIVVYPTPYGHSLLASKHLNNSHSGDMSDFNGIKRFDESASISTIHWASLAKSDTLMSKMFAYEEEQKQLHFDFSKLSGSVEQRLSQLTLWVLECETNRFDFTMGIDDELFDSKKGEIDEILTKLALYR
jgi:uncharacterized protein (DUF58 family)